jgi:hypothetical protein
MQVAEEKEKEINYEVDEGVDLESTDINHEEEDEQETEKKVKEESETEASKNAEEESDDEVEKYGQKVQRRIAKLTFQAKEAERREQAALKFAQGVKSELDASKQKANTNEEQLFGEYGTRIKSELAQAKAMYKQALELQDPDAIVEATQVLSRLSTEQENVNRVRQKRETHAKRAEQNQQMQEQQRAFQHRPVQQQPPKPDPVAQQWAEENVWFGDNKAMTYAALGFHKDIVEEGVDPKSDLYYNTLNTRLKESFPSYYSNLENTNKRATKQSVVGATRSGKADQSKKVKLTQSEIAMANKLGVPLSEYAKYKVA